MVDEFKGLLDVNGVVYEERYLPENIFDQYIGRFSRGSREPWVSPTATLFIPLRGRFHIIQSAYR